MVSLSDSIFSLFKPKATVSAILLFIIFTCYICDCQAYRAPKDHGQPEGVSPAGFVRAQPHHVHHKPLIRKVRIPMYIKKSSPIYPAVHAMEWGYAVAP